MFISMWISNTAAAAMMCPIVEAVLVELESQGIVEIYEKTLDEEVGEEGEEQKRPTKSTICNYLSIAYAASIGGMGCLIGSGTNLTFKGKNIVGNDRKLISFTFSFFPFQVSTKLVSPTAQVWNSLHGWSSTFP